MNDPGNPPGPPWLRLRAGVALSITDEAPGLQIVQCSVEDATDAEAVAYTALVGTVRRFDRLLLNTTAVDLSLGSGGRHFVVANLTRPEVEPEVPLGHVVKARYTPLQCVVKTAEESGGLTGNTDFLSGMSVVCCELLSQSIAAVAGFRYRNRGGRIAVVVTDEAALPVVLSDDLRRLRACIPGLGIISSGQAFGGDYEAVNLYSALLTAKHVVKASVVFVTPGPGTVGTGTRWGFGGVAQGQALNAACALRGTPIGVVRASNADPRPRHQGISHHTQTVFSRVAMGRFQAAWPLPSGEEYQDDWNDLFEMSDGRMTGHRVVGSADALDEWESEGHRLHSMGRNRRDDPLFFEAAAAAGILAATLLERLEEL